jgi:hypothetical protein
MPGRRTIALIIALNLLPMAGVLLWDWRAFDLIFLYWMENLVIGAFSALRMLARPYQHPIDLVFPLFLAPFFVFHYGAFCWGHGTFVMSMFAPSDATHEELFTAVLQALENTSMLMAVLALVALQMIDWLRDSYRHGFGSDGVKDLMVAPYRRIVVLHITIIFGGFALMALDEPTVGLLLLIALKTASDIYHWGLDNADTEQDQPFELSDEQLQEMRDTYSEPKVTVNGEERFFESFAAMRDSKEFRMMQSVLRLMGARKEMKIIDTYLDMKISEERTT